jgi:hypothetical protein
LKLSFKFSPPIERNRPISFKPPPSPPLLPPPLPGPLLNLALHHHQLQQPDQDKIPEFAPEKVPALEVAQTSCRRSSASAQSPYFLVLQNENLPASVVGRWKYWLFLSHFHAFLK